MNNMSFNFDPNPDRNGEIKNSSSNIFTCFCHTLLYQTEACGGTAIVRAGNRLSRFYNSTQPVLLVLENSMSIL